jgi:hypothetical protein
MPGNIIVFPPSFSSGTLLLLPAASAGIAFLAFDGITKWFGRSIFPPRFHTDTQTDKVFDNIFRAASHAKSDAVNYDQGKTEQTPPVAAR